MNDAAQQSGSTAICVSGSHCDREASLEEAARLLKSAKQSIWVHLNVRDRDVASQWLTAELGFHELAVEDALSPNERPALTEYEDHLFFVLPVINSTNSHEEYVEVGFFLKKHYLVTVSESRCAVIEAWVDRWSKQRFPATASAADLLHMIVDSIVDAYIPVIDGIEDEIDDIADEVFTGDKSRVVQLIQQKRRLVDMRRRAVPLRDVVNGLLRRDIGLIPDRTRPYFQDVYDHASRVNESIDLQRDTLTTLLDVHLSVVSNNLNEVMRKMTVISTVLMTSALIAGVYGMNFTHMPELHWTFGYPMAIGLMILSSLGILALFRWKKWL